MSEHQLLLAIAYAIEEGDEAAYVAAGNALSEHYSMQEYADYASSYDEELSF